MQPFYVGKGAKQRWKFHLWEAGKYKAGTLNKVRFVNMPKVKKIIEIWDSGNEPIITKVFFGSDNECSNEEIKLIAAIGRLPNGPLLNMTDGGDGTSGYKRSPEQCAAMSLIRKGKPGRPHTEDHKQKMRERNKGGEATRKSVSRFTLNGSVIDAYPSLSALAKEIGMTKGNTLAYVVKDGSLPYQGLFYRYSESDDITPDGIKDAVKLIERRKVVDRGAVSVKPISKVSLDGDVLALYESVRAAEAANPETKYAALWAAVKYNRAYKGFRWCYS